MTDDTCAIANKVHALLFSALPHAGDTDLAKAAELATTSLGEDDNAQKNVFLVIWKIAASAGRQKLLLGTVRTAGQW